MLTTEAWLRLIDGLVKATRLGGLKWTVITPGSRPALSRTALELEKVLPGDRPRFFEARTSSTRYELLSDDRFGRAPYALRVRERNGQSWNLIGEITSSTNIGDRDRYEINLRLEALFEIVGDTVESADQIVSRLLQDLPMQDD